MAGSNATASPALPAALLGALGVWLVVGSVLALELPAQGLLFLGRMALAAAAGRLAYDALRGWQPAIPLGRLLAAAVAVLGVAAAILALEADLSDAAWRLVDGAVLGILGGLALLLLGRFGAGGTPDTL